MELKFLLLLLAARNEVHNLGEKKTQLNNKIITIFFIEETKKPQNLIYFYLNIFLIFLKIFALKRSHLKVFKIYLVVFNT